MLCVFIFNWPIRLSAALAASAHSWYQVRIQGRDFINVIKTTSGFNFIYTFLAGGWEDTGSVVNLASLSRIISTSVF